MTSLAPVNDSVTQTRRPMFGFSPHWALVLPVILILVLFYLVPLGSVLWLSFTTPEPGFGNYALLFESSSIQRVFANTFKVAAITTAVSLLLGYLIAYVMVHATNTHRAWITAFVIVPFWVSVLVRAFAWIMLLRTEGIVNNALIGSGLIANPLPMVRNEFGVLVGMVHYMIPYAVLPIYSNLRGINPALVSASRSLGAGPVRTFVSVYLPMSRPGIISAGILVFILSLGFLVTPALLGGGRVTMIAEYVRLQIFQTVRWGPGTMTASVLLLTVVLLLLVMSRVIDIKKVFGAQ